MDNNIVRKKILKRNKDEYKTKKRIQPEMYNQKFTAPLRRKRKNEYDANEEAR